MENQIINSHYNRSSIRARFSQVSKLLTTEDHEKATMQNEIEILDKEFELIKKRSFYVVSKSR